MAQDCLYRGMVNGILVVIRVERTSWVERRPVETGGAESITVNSSLSQRHVGQMGWVAMLTLPKVHVHRCFADDGARQICHDGDHAVDRPAAGDARLTWA